MKNEFIPYEQALELKELGFDEPCFTYYYDINGNIRSNLSVDIHNAWTYAGTKKLAFTLAPLYQQVFKWFRENHNLCTVIIPTITMYWTFKIIIVVESSIVEVPPYTNVDDNNYPTYEDAELECIKKLISIIKNQKK